MNKYKIILLEGTDCAGKTTFFRQINKNTSFRHIIIDRSFLSSIVYNSVMKRNEDIEEELRVDLENMLHKDNCYLVLLSPSLKCIQARFEQRGDWMIKENQLREIHNKYVSEIENLSKKFPKKIIILSDDDTTNNCDNFMNILENIDNEKNS